MVIVGLGNIGKEYELTHHNVGFMALDSIASSNNLTFSLEKKFQAYVCQYIVNGKKHYLIKPTTYMNNSGIAVKLFADYYNIPMEDIFVIYDDLDLPLSNVRIRKNGSSGTHNGMKSIISHLGSDKFPRCRIGIAKQKEMDTINYVLSKFSKKELETIKHTIDIMPNMIDDLLNNGVDFIMNHYNGSAKE